MSQLNGNTMLLVLVREPWLFKLNNIQGLKSLTASLFSYMEGDNTARLNLTHGLDGLASRH